MAKRDVVTDLDRRIEAWRSHGGRGAARYHQLDIGRQFTEALEIMTEARDEIVALRDRNHTLLPESIAVLQEAAQVRAEALEEAARTCERLVLSGPVDDQTSEAIRTIFEICAKAIRSLKERE